MPKRTNQFQDIIADIYRTLADTGATFEESAMVSEPDGTLREIDILIKSVVAGSEISLAIECRDYSRAQSIEWVDSLIGKYQSLPVDKVVAVSSSGFSEPSILKASRHRIQCLSAEKAEDIDWAAKFCDPWKSFYYGLRLFHLGSYKEDGSKLTHTSIDEDDITTHDDDLSERLFPTLYNLFKEHYASRIQSEHDKVIAPFWTDIPDGDKRYFEVSIDNQITVVPPGETYTISRLLFGVGAIYNWKDIEPYSQVLHDRVATSLVDGTANLTIIRNKEGEHSATIFRIKEHGSERP
jgi:Restriction endonuclease